MFVLPVRPLPLLLALLFAAGASALHAADTRPVSFQKDLAPLLHRRCAGCHNEETPKGQYRLDTFAKLQKPGDSEEAPLVAGKPEDSELYRLIVTEDPHDRMPQKADPLPTHEIVLVKRWIAEGAKFDGGAPDRPLVEMARELLLAPAPEKYPKPVPISALAFSPDNSYLAVAGYHEVMLWRLSDGALVRRIGGMPERINALAWHPKRNLLAVAGGTPGQWGTVALIDVKDNWKTRILCDLADTGLAVAFNPDGTVLAAGSADRSTRLFDTKTGQQLKLLKHHADWVQSVAFSPDGSRLLTASRDRTVRICIMPSGDLVGTYTEHEAPVLQALYSGSTGVLTLGAKAKELHRWNSMNPGTKGQLLRIGGSEVTHVAFNGWGVISASRGGEILVTQYTDAQRIFQLQGHRGPVQSLATSSNAGVFASATFNGEICVWDLACGTYTSRFWAVP